MAKKSSSRGIGLEATCVPYRPTPQQAQQEKRWRAESDLRTLREAEQVRADPGRVKMAKAIAAEEIKALSRVAKK